MVRILYIARHNQRNSADDEGAIKHVLEALGHSVMCQQEADTIPYATDTFDFCLFHKWDDSGRLASIKCPKIFWYFDLVDWPHDPTLHARCQQRVDWMARILPHVDLGFCTDGDWVTNAQLRSDVIGQHSHKLHWLTQGADERMVGRHADFNDNTRTILFTGIGRGGGQGRQAFVDFMKRTFGTKFVHVEKGYYGRSLAGLVWNAAIVVAPDSPITHLYWSNRIFTSLGVGAFLIHPRCAGLEGYYEEGTDIVYYPIPDHGGLRRLVNRYLDDPAERKRISDNGLRVTQERHLYRHRVVALLRIVKERRLV